MTALKTEKLTKYYGKKRGIVNVDLAVDEGEFFGFIGPNGAGKSTTIRNLLGLVSPSGGELISSEKASKTEDGIFLPMSDICRPSRCFTTE